jgi:hypothetical protein
MNPQKKLVTQQKTEEEQRLLGGQQTESQTALEFAGAEEMLRHDALHTPVPPAIAQRLQESIGKLPLPSRGWWRRLLGQ